MNFLAKYFKTQRVKTIIINLSSDLKLAAISAKLAGVENIIYRRGSALAIKNSWLNRLLLQKFVTQIIANSNETKRTILANNINIVDDKKIKIIYNGIDLSNFETSEFTPIINRQKDEIIIGNASRFSEEKGHEFLIEMARILNEQKVNFKLLLAGKGKLENKFKKQVEALELTDKVIFLGFVNDMKSFNKSIDIFVLSSRYEWFGYVLVEAMAQQKPVLAFDIGSSSEIIENEVNGFLIEKFNVQDLVSKIIYLAENKDIRSKMGTSG